MSSPIPVANSPDDHSSTHVQESSLAAAPSATSAYRRPPVDDDGQRYVTRSLAGSDSAAAITITPAMLLELPFRHRRIILTSVLIAALLGWLAILVWPRVYESQMKLNIRVGRESVALDPTVTTSDTMLMQKTREEEVVSTLEVLGSRQVMMRVVDEIGADNILDGTVPSKDGKAAETPWHRKAISQARDVISSAVALTGVKDDVSSRELAILQLQGTVAIYAPKKSSVVTVNSESRSPEMAKLILDTFAKIFMQEHQAASGTPGSYSFFEAETSRSQGTLNQLIRARATFLTENDMVSIDTTRQILKDKITSVTQSILATDALLEKHETQVTQLQTKVDVMEDRMLSSEKEVASNAWSLLRQRVFELEVAEKKIATFSTAQNPQLINARQELADARKVLAETDRSRKDSDTIANPAKIAAQQDLRKLKTELIGLRALQTEKNLQLERLRDESHKLIENERRMIAMDREIDLTERSLAVLNSKLEEARLIQELEREQISNLSIFQPAQLTERPLKPNKKLLAVGFVFLGLCSGFGLAITREISDRRIRRPDHLAKFVDSDWVTSIPKLSKRQADQMSENDQASARIENFLREVLSREPAPWQDQTQGICIGVLGCERGSGSSTISRALVQVGQETLGLECDHVDPSRYDAANSKRQNAQVASQTASGPAMTQTSNRLDDVLTPAKQNHDLVVIDLPSASTIVHPATASDRIDFVVLVVEAEKSEEPTVRRVVDRFVMAAARNGDRPRLAGIILNKCTQPIPKVLRRLARADV